MGFDDSFITATFNMFCVSPGTPLSESEGGYSGQVLYALPKAAGVYQSSVLNATASIDYYRIDFYGALQSYIMGKFQPSSGSGTSLVVGLDGRSLELLFFDNITSADGRQVAARQSLGDVLPEYIYTKQTVSQPNPTDLESSGLQRLFTMHYHDYRLYFATEVALNVSSSTGAQNTGIQWFALNVGNLSTDGSTYYNGVRKLSGAYLEATALLDSSVLGEDVDVFFPALAVDDNGRLGEQLTDYKEVLLISNLPSCLW